MRVTFLMAFRLNRLTAFIILVVVDQRKALLYVAAKLVPKKASDKHNDGNAEIRHQCLIVSHIHSLPHLLEYDSHQQEHDADSSDNENERKGETATVSPRHFERVKNQQQYRRLSEKIAQHFRDIFWTTPSRHYAASCLECSIVTRVVL
jgi:hypothetical protein